MKSDEIIARLQTIENTINHTNDSVAIEREKVKAIITLAYAVNELNWNLTFQRQLYKDIANAIGDIGGDRE